LNCLPTECWNCSCRGHTSWLHNGTILRDYSTGSLYGFSPRVLSTGSLHGFSLRVLSTGSLFGLFFGLFLGTTVLIILSIYMGPVDPQVDHHQAIQSILCCAYITTSPVIFITEVGIRNGKGLTYHPTFAEMTTLPPITFKIP
jgi:hypothetical protein